ncbi:MAG: Holliday junction resolvase RuvX [Myxococcota bacterium]
MLTGKRLLALDVGSRRIGVAVSDHAGMLAHPLVTLDAISLRQDSERIVALARKEEAEGVVVGLPAHADQSESGSAKRARRLGEALAAAGLAVDYMDEWGTSLEAKAALAHLPKSKRREKGAVDQAAAVAILTGYLEARDRQAH